MPPKGPGKSKGDEEADGEVAVVEIHFSGLLTTLPFTSRVPSDAPETARQPEATASPQRPGKEGKAGGAGKGGKGGKVEDSPPPRPALPTVLKEPYFLLTLPGDAEPRRTPVIETVDFSLGVAHFSFSVTKDHVMTLGNDIAVHVMSNEPLTEAELEAIASSPKVKKGKEGGKKEKPAAKKAPEATAQYVPIARFVFNMAPIVLGASSSTLVMKGENPALLDPKARQPLYGFDELTVTCTLTEKRRPLLSEEQMLEWCPMMVSILGLSNMADNCVLFRPNQEPEFADLRQACTGVYATYRLLPSMPLTFTPQFTHARNIGIQHSALFLLGDLLRQPGCRTASSVLDFIKFHFSHPFEVEVHDRDPKESGLHPDDKAVQPTEGSPPPAGPGPAAPNLQYGVCRTSFHPLLGGELTLKASEQILPFRVATEEKQKCPDPSQPAMAGSMMGFDLQHLFADPPRDTVEALTNLAPIMVQRGRYLEWQSSLSFKVSLARAIPRLTFVLPPEPPLPSRLEDTLPAGTPARLRTPVTTLRAAAAAAPHSPAPAGPAADGKHQHQHQHQECGPFTRMLVVMPYECRPQVLQALLAAVMQTNRAAEEDDVVEAPPPSPPAPLGEVESARDKKPRPSAEPEKRPTPSRAKPGPAPEPPAPPLSGKAPAGPAESAPAPHSPRPAPPATVGRRALPVTAADAVSGFEVNDGVHRTFVLEAMADSGMQRVLTALMAVLRDEDHVKVLFNPTLAFPKREYVRWPPLTKRVAAAAQPEVPAEEEDERLAKGRAAAKGKKPPPKGKKDDKESLRTTAQKGRLDLPASPMSPVATSPSSEGRESAQAEAVSVDGVGGRIHRIRLRHTVEWLFAQRSNYVKRRATDDAARCVDRLVRLLAAPTLQHVVQERLFPTAAELVETEIQYGRFLSNRDQSGAEDQIIVDGQPQESRSDRPPAEAVFAAPPETAGTAPSEQQTELPWQTTMLATDFRDGRPVDLAGHYGRGVRLVGSVGTNPDLPPTSAICKDQPGAKCWMFVPDLQQWVALLLGDLPRPAKPLRYAVLGRLQPATLAGAWATAGPPGWSAVRVLALQEAVKAAHVNETVNLAYTRHVAAEQRRLPCTQYAAQQAHRREWHDLTHTLGPVPLPGPDGTVPVDDSRSVASSDAAAYNFADLGQPADAGLVEPPPFPPVVPDYPLVNRLRYAAAARTFTRPAPPPRPRSAGDSPEPRTSPGRRAQDEAFHRAFKFMAQKTALEDNAHPKKPSEYRIEDLKQPWEPPVAKLPKRPECDFDLFGKPEGLQRQEFLRRATAKEVQEMKAREEAEWRSKVVVGDVRFHVRMASTAVPDALDKYTHSMLKDPPQKRTLKLMHGDEPPPASIFIPEPDLSRSGRTHRACGPGFLLLDDDALSKFVAAFPGSPAHRTAQPPSSTGRPTATALG